MTREWKARGTHGPPVQSEFQRAERGSNRHRHSGKRQEHHFQMNFRPAHAEPEQESDHRHVNQVQPMIATPVAFAINPGGAMTFVATIAHTLGGEKLYTPGKWWWNIRRNGPASGYWLTVEWLVW